MKRTFWTRNLFIGVLMGLVMLLGVQESADALTFGTTRRGDLATKGIGEDFTITFSVTLGGNTTAARNPAGQLISAPSTGSGVRIDSSGYPVTDITVGGRSREYRNFENQPTAPTGDTLVIDPRPRLSTDGTAGSPTTDYYISGSNIVDSNGQTVYVQTGDGSADTPWQYTAARSSLGTPAAQINNADRYHYNDERVTVAVTGANIIKVGSTSITGTANLTLRETLADSTDARANTDAGTKLTSSVTLTLRAAAAATVEIDITDVTPAHDRPGDPAPQQDFTVYVVNERATPAASPALRLVTGQNYQTDRNDFGDQPITPPTLGTGNIRIEYSVVEGPGRLYVETADRKTSPARTIVTSDVAIVMLDMNGGTNKVRATAAGAAPTTGIFIFGFPKVTIVSGNNQEGSFGGQLDDPLVVKVTDGKGRALSGLAADFDTEATEALFIPVPRTTVYTTDAAGSTLAAARTDFTRVATSTRPPPAADIVVQTDSRGEASTYFQLGTTTSETSQTVTVSAGGANLIVPPNFRFNAESGERRPTLSILSGDNQTTDSNGDLDDPLVVVVRQDGRLKPGEEVTFHTSKGTLIGRNQADDDDLTDKRVYGMTDGRGRAEVQYFQDPGEGSDTVTATISGSDPAYEREVVFSINGGSSTRPPTTREPAAPRNAISLQLSSSTGEPGDEVTVFVTSDPTGQVVTINSGELDDDDFSDLSDITPFRSTLTLPSEDGEYDFSASGPAGFTSASATVTVETGILGRITISQIGQPSGGAQNFSIGVVDTDGDRISGALTVRVSGSGFTTRNIETLDGFGNARLTLPTTAGLYTLTASAEDYTPGTTQVRIAAPEPPQDTAEEEEEEEEEAPEPASIEISGPSTRTGTANTAIEAALLVQVLDDDDDAIEDARVIFRVRTGQGRLSQRGNGRAVAVQTDSRGYARAEYTPISASSTVEAEVRGVRTPVTFTITATDAAPSTDTPDTGEDTPPDTIRPTVHTPAAQRPPMLWVAGGKIYSLVSTEVREFAPNLNNVMNITIGGGKVYWTAKTSASSGTINAANLDGSGVKELKSIMAIPMGIAVDTRNSLLYWTNSRGRIQSANLDGSGIQNVMENLRNPNDLALAGGNVYWTESNHGSVRFVNLRGQKQVRVISTGDNPAGSLAIANGKVYWTEQVGESGGTINVANLNGSGATELASILATPIGIAVDTARSKLYWTNARGRVQSASLSGSSIRNVVGGLESPGEIVISNSIKAPKATTAAKPTTTTAKGKYDINGDGSVDDKDVDMLLLAVLSELTAAKYDVNGDGSVDVKDVREVNKNLDTGAAGAPALLGRKFSAVERDRLQDQIDLLVATNDRSPATLKTLIYLQQLLAMARPEKTQLLANFPNPFNPETWIPYELATDTNVKITIYTSTGVVVRALLLGHQPAGYYTDRERAAYWDGRNALGEQVASGIYFYHFETDEMSSMRKMVILK